MAVGLSIRLWSKHIPDSTLDRADPNAIRIDIDCWRCLNLMLTCLDPTPRRRLARLAQTHLAHSGTKVRPCKRVESDSSLYCAINALVKKHPGAATRSQIAKSAEASVHAPNDAFARSKIDASPSHLRRHRQTPRMVHFSARICVSEVQCPKYKDGGFCDAAKSQR